MPADLESAMAGERMAVDAAFEDRVAASSLTPQQWNVAMTAIEFRVEGPADPETASLVPDTSGLDAVLDAMADAGRRGAGARGAGPDVGVGAGREGGTGLLDRLLGALGIGAGGGRESDHRDAVERLAGEYCERLEAELKEHDRWDEICRRATTPDS